MALESSRFTMLNTRFACEACGYAVPPAARTSRNHCPKCLTSKHVDLQPGDRAATCGALMDAFAYEVKSGLKIDLLFRCRRCAKIGRNKAVQEVEDPDDFERILKLTSKGRLG